MEFLPSEGELEGYVLSLFVIHPPPQLNCEVGPLAEV